ncbi:MAG TPA: hypothetical protein VLC53_13565 [Myxococcota bacterium]|nr:hypothetical protein [Myxococcota bacterium]
MRAALEGDPALGALAPLWIDLVGVLEGTPLTDAGAAALLGELDLPADAARSLSHAVRRAAARLRGRSGFPLRPAPCTSPPSGPPAA